MINTKKQDAKQNKNKHYKFTDKQHSVEGIISSVLAVISIAILVSGIGISFHNKGNANAIVGVLGLLAFLIAITGFAVAMHSFKKKDLFYLFSYIGAIANTVVWFIMLCVIMIGI